jgi:hypothetical protein
VIAVVAAMREERAASQQRGRRGGRDLADAAERQHDVVAGDPGPEQPVLVARTVSDRADAAAHGDFQTFLREVAAPSAHDLVIAALGRL